MAKELEALEAEIFDQERAHRQLKRYEMSCPGLLPGEPLEPRQGFEREDLDDPLGVST